MPSIIVSRQQSAESLSEDLINDKIPFSVQIRVNGHYLFTLPDVGYDLTQYGERMQISDCMHGEGW